MAKKKNKKKKEHKEKKTKSIKVKNPIVAIVDSKTDIKTAIPPMFKDEEGFIFEPEKIWKNSSFPFAQFGDIFAFGLLQPKIVPVIVQGITVAMTQQARPVFVTSDHQHLEVTHDFTRKTCIKIPEIPSELKLRWSLPSIQAWIDNKTPVINGQTLFKTIRKKYEDHCYMRDGNWYDVHALWDIGTYFFFFCDAYPIFELRGQKRTGKTRIMEVSQLITFNSTGIMSNPSEATLYRQTHEARPTKYIDEAERLFYFDKNKKGFIADARAELLNSSYKRGARVPRQEAIGKKWHTVWYDVYSPSMIGSINGLQGATEDRAIIHVTTRIPSNDNRGDLTLPENPSGEWQNIIDDLYCFALQNWKTFQEKYLAYKNDTKLRNRDLLLWKPLFILTQMFDADLYSRMKTFAEKLSEVKTVNSIDNESLEIIALTKMWNLLQDNTTVLIKDIRDLFTWETKPHVKTIGNILDKLGLMEFKKHTENGNGYEISKEQFREVIEPYFSSIFQTEKEGEEKPELPLQTVEKPIIREREGENSILSSFHSFPSVIDDKKKDNLKMPEENNQKMKENISFSQVQEKKEGLDEPLPKNEENEEKSLKWGDMAEKDKIQRFLYSLEQLQGNSAFKEKKGVGVLDLMTHLQMQEKDVVSILNYLREKGEVQEVRPDRWRVIT